MKDQIIVLFFLLLPTLSESQTFSNADIKKVSNSQRVHYYYNDTLMGCNFDLECRGLDVEFNHVSYNRKTKRFYFSGNVYMRTLNRPMPGTKIFAAKVKDSILFDVRILDSTRRRKDDKVFPYNMGKFSGSIVLSKGDKLYIHHPSFFLLEYNIEELLRNYKR